MSDEQNQTEEIYKSYISEALKGPDFKKEKKAFLNTHFPVSSPLVFRPAFSLAFGAVLSVAVLFFVLQKPEPQPVSSPALQTPAAPVVKPHPNIIVHGASSSIGPTMVYQKPNGDAPLTVIWVIPGGGN